MVKFVPWAEIGRALGVIELEYLRLSVHDALWSAQDQPESSTLPGSSPFNDGTLWLVTAQERASGLLPANSAEVDGWVGISNTAPFSYSANTMPAAGQYYLIGALEHEFTGTMGRLSLIGADIGGTEGYSVMDLCRFSSSVTHQLGAGSPAYFPIGNRNTKLGNWNTNPDGNFRRLDSERWTRRISGVQSTRQIQNMSAADLTLMNTIGWKHSNLSGTTIPAIPVEASMYGVVGTQAEMAAFRENDIDETVLPSLTEEQKQLGVASLGHRVKLLDCPLSFYPPKPVPVEFRAPVKAGRSL